MNHRVMQPYASRTGTRRNLDALRGAGWKLLVSARGVLRSEGFDYALDNGAWTAHQRGEEFDVAAFERALELLGQDAEWVVAPDIVGGGLRSLRMSESWIPRLEWCRVTLLAVQDGIHPGDVRAMLGPELGIFVGGTTEWKLSTLAAWGELARERSCHLHVARVNTARRIHLCHDAGAHSFDGSSASRFAKTLPLLNNAARQGQLFSHD